MGKDRKTAMLHLHSQETRGMGWDGMEELMIRSYRASERATQEAGVDD